MAKKKKEPEKKPPFKLKKPTDKELGVTTGFTEKGEKIRVPLTRAVSATEMTEEQRRNIELQKKNRAAGFTSYGEQKPITQVDVRRAGTREEVTALEDRPGVTPPELTPEVGEPPGFFGEPSAVLPGKTRGETLGLAAAAGATIAVGGAALIATAGLSGAGTAIAATGSAARLAKATGYISRVLPKTAVTTKGAKLILSYLGKAVAQLKRPSVVLAILGTGLYTSYFWAPNEKGDAMTTLTIAQKEALRLKDYEGVLEIGEDMKEANEIAATLPVIGFTQAEKAKFNAAIKASEVYTNQAKNKMAEGEEPEEQRPPPPAAAGGAGA